MPAFVPTRAQRAILDSKARFVVASGAIRSGKSICATAAFVDRIIEDIGSGKAHPLAWAGAFSKRAQPRLTYWAIAPTYALASQLMAYLFGFIDRGLVEKFDEHSLTMWLRTDKGAVKIAVKSAENPDMLVADAVDGALIDEAARCDAMAWRGALRGRLITSRGWAIFATSPFTGRGNWVYADLVSKAGGDPDIAVFPLRALDNPSFPVDEVERMRRQLPPTLFRRDILGDWGAWSSGVYEEWDPKIHVVTADELRIEHGLGRGGELRRIVSKAWAGVDFGWTDPSAIEVLVQTTRGDFVVVDEVYGSNILVSSPQMSKGTLVAHAYDLQRRWGVNMWLCDGADPEAIAQFGHSGLNALRADKARIDGVRRVAMALRPAEQTQRPMLRVLDTCKHLVDELGRLEWKRDRAGDVVEGEFSDSTPRHAADALRYVVGEALRYADDGLPKVPVMAQGVGLGTFVGWKRA